MEIAHRIDAGEIRHIATLANLELSAKEVDDLGADLQSILNFVAALNSVDTTDLAPMAQINELLHPGQSTALRDDIKRVSAEREVILAEAPETDGRFFKVPKVIER